MLGNILSKTIDKNITKYIIIFLTVITLFVFYQNILSLANLIKFVFIIVILGLFIYRDYFDENDKNNKLKQFGKDFSVNELLSNTDIIDFLEHRKYIKEINKNTYFDIIKHCTYFIKPYKLSIIDKENAKMYYDCANDEKNEIINLMSSLTISKTLYDHYSKNPDYEMIEKDINRSKHILNNYLRKIGLISIDTWEEDIDYTKKPFYNEKVQPRDKHNSKTNII